MWKSRALFIVVFIMAVVFAITYKDPSIGLSVVYAMFFMFIPSLLSVVLGFFLISVEETVGSDVLIKNEKISYSVNVKNKGLFFYPNVKKEYYNEDIFNYKSDPKNKSYLNARDMLINKYELNFPYRGVYEIGLKKVTVVDFLGLFRMSFRMKNPTVVTVFPTYSKDMVPGSLGNNTPTNNIQFNEDYTSISEIRKYVSTDHIKRIHWKLTAKRGELMVKKFNYFDKDKALFYLDTSELPLDNEDKLKLEDTMVSYVAGSVDTCAEGNVETTLLYGESESDHFTISDSHQVNMAFKKLAEIKFCGEKNNIDYIRFLSKAHSYVLYLSGINEGIYQTILSLHTSDNNVIVYYFYCDIISIDENSKRILTDLRLSGVEVNKIKV